MLAKQQYWVFYEVLYEVQLRQHLVPILFSFFFVSELLLLTTQHICLFFFEVSERISIHLKSI